MSNRFNLGSQAQKFYPEIRQVTSRGLRASTPVKIQALKDNMVRLANQEWERWGRGTIKEWDEKLRPVLQDYWLTGTGTRFSEPGWWSKHAWSAAFISWIMKKARAGDSFRYAGAHAVYIKAAKDNRLANNSNPFKAYRVNEIRPQVGDLVCKSRAGSGANYENIRPGHKTHCDIVTEVRPNRLATIGGNVKNSVSKTFVSINANGYINHPGYFAVIRIATPSPLDRREIGPFEIFAEVDRATRSDIELSDQEWEEERGRRMPIRAARFRSRAVGRRRLPTRPGRPTRLRWRRRLAIFPEPSVIEQGPQDAEYIRWVQSSLNRILGLRLPVDGIMEPETRSAIRSFQKRQGLAVTGIVGPETERALIAAGADQPPETQEFEALESEISRSNTIRERMVRPALQRVSAAPASTTSLRKGPRVVLIPGVLGSAIADRSLTPAQARAICEKNIGRLISPSGPFYPCSRQPELLWGGIGSLHWFFDATAWGQRMRSGNGWDNGGMVAPAGLFEIDIKLRSTRIELKPYASLITTLRKAGADVLVFAYDWRLSNTHNAALLAREILRTWFGGALPEVSAPREQRITFIGHSMGGLLARYLIETQPRWAGLARRLITIGTPHRGAPQAFLHFIGRTFPFPRAPYYGWVDAIRPTIVAAPLSAGALLLPGPVQTTVFKSMASSAELMPVYNFVQSKSRPEAYPDTYRGQIHPPTGKPVLNIIDNLRRGMINDRQLEAWLRMHMLDYHCVAATGVETVSGYDRDRDRILTTRDGDGSVPRSSALLVPTASSRVHLKMLATGGHAHARLCERDDVQAYILGTLRDVARATSQTAHAAKSGRGFGTQLIQPDDFAAMARWILSGEPLKPLGVGEVLSVTRLLAGDGGGPLIDAQTERVGTKLMLKNPPKHIVGREVFSVPSPRHGLFQYVWISSMGSGISRGGMLFLPKPRPHELHHAYLVTFNPERLDKRFANACTNAHHAEMQLVEWVGMQPKDWQARLGTVLISNRSRTKNRGYSPCASCCDDLAWFLTKLKNLPRRSGRPVTVEAGISWLTLYTYAKICPSHPTTPASLRLMHDSGWKLGGPGWTTPPPAQQPIRRPARPSPVPAHIP